MKKLINVLGIFTLALVMAACGQKKQTERIGGPRGDRSGLNTTQNGQPIGGGSAENGWSTIENRSEIVAVNYNTSLSTRFSGQGISQAQAIDGLVSSFININDSNQYGGVSSYGAIAFGGQLRFTGTQVDANNSRIGLVIFDGLAKQDDSMAIRIYMGPERAKVGGSVDATGKFNVQFNDDFGYVRIVGQIVSGRLYGDIYFKNTKSLVNHFTTNVETYLGSVQVSQNGILF